MTPLPRIITMTVLLALVGCSKPPPQAEAVPAEPESEPEAKSEPKSEPAAEPKPAGTTQLGNPASANCEQKGGKLEIVKAADGGEQGMCVLPDGTRCEEWAYMRGECP